MNWIADVAEDSGLEAQQSTENVVDLSEFLPNDEVVSGYKLGKKVAEASGIDEYHSATIRVPDSALLLTSSFLRGFLENVAENFEERFKFEGNVNGATLKFALKEIRKL